MEPIIWSMLEEGELLLETCFAQLDAPGALGLTSRRLLFAGRGALFRRRQRIVSIPRSDLEELRVHSDRFDTELRARTSQGTYGFFDLEAADAHRMVTAHEQSAIDPTASAAFAQGHGPRLHLAPFVVIGLGAFALIWSGWAGVSLIVAGVVYVLVRRSRAARIPPPPI
jgi:hypothetical protein